MCVIKYFAGMFWLCLEMFLHILPTFFLQDVFNQSRESNFEVAHSITASDTDLIRFHRGI